MSAIALPELTSARVERVDGSADRLFALSLSRPGWRGALLLFLDEPVGWGLASERPRGAPASSLVRLLRKHLAGGRIVAMRAEPDRGVIELERGPSRVELAIVGASPHLRLMVEGAAIAMPPEPRTGAFRLELPLDSESADARARLARGSEDELALRRAEILRAIGSRERKLRRRLEAIEGDLRSAEGAPRLRHLGSLLLAGLRDIPARASEAFVTDWTLDPPAPIRIPIDPGRDAKSEAEGLFKKARKLERGGVVGLQRRAQTEAELGSLGALAERTQHAEPGDLAAIEGALGRSPVRPSARKPSIRLPFRRFRASGDRVVLVGRSAADNDALTLHHARPHDLWLHARGVSGSHVVVPLERDEIRPSLLVDAAHLAARFSDARAEPVVDVQYVARRFVRKPRGSPPGRVAIEREKVIAVRIEPARMAKLLEGEI